MQNKQGLAGGTKRVGGAKQAGGAKVLIRLAPSCATLFVQVSTAYDRALAVARFKRASPRPPAP
jgi:hypothetical protein